MPSMAANKTDQPEALHDLRLGPAKQFEMQVDGRHLEETPSMGHFEINDLDDVAQRLADRDDGDDRQQGPLAGHQGDDADGGAQ